MIHPVEPPAEGIPRITLPPWLHDIESPSPLDSGEKEALSMLMATYAYSSDISGQQRNVQKLLQITEAFLVKTGKWDNPYASFYDHLWSSWVEATNEMTSPQNIWAARVLFSDIERALTIVAKKEGFTQDSKELYDGRTDLVASEPPAAAGDPYGL